MSATALTPLRRQQQRCLQSLALQTAPTASLRLRATAWPASHAQAQQYSRSASSSAAPSSSKLASSSSKPAQTPKQRTGVFRPSPLSPSAPPQKSHSKLTVAVVQTLAKLMGYNRMGSSAIRVTSDLYDRCSEAGELQRDFWYRDAGLPATYQTWFHITHLHVWLLQARFRALASPPAPSGASQAYAQELINHFFIDAESRMRQRFGVQTARLVKGYMKDMHQQQRGALVGLDQGLADTADDTQLAAALWRNLWGAGGFGGHVGGVKRKIRGIDRTEKGQDPSEEGTPDLKIDEHVAADEAANAFAKQHPELAFPQNLERLTLYVRREVQRLGNISDADVLAGRLGGGNHENGVLSGSIFGKI